MVTSRILFTAKQKDELWERWKNGQSVLAISRVLERRNKTGVQRIVALNGGIAPAPRCRAVAALKLEEREEISRAIADGRRPSERTRFQTIAMEDKPEIIRNGGSQTYRANRAERSAWERALRPKPCREAIDGELRWRVAQKLALQWSPEQISGWLKQQFPTDRDMRITQGASYRILIVQTRGLLKKELTAQLRTRRQMRHATGGKAKNDRITYSIWSLSAIRPSRPRIAQFLAIGKTILLTGASDRHIVTLVESHSRFRMLVKLPRKDTTTVVAALDKQIRKLLEQIRRSLKWDRGKEMCGHKRFTGDHERAYLLL